MKTTGSPTAATLIARFKTKYKVDLKTKCWLWTAGKFQNGYGNFWDGKRTQGAHRAAYELFVGAIPEGLCVLHRCDTPACVNPEHLFLGNTADNVADKIAKGRLVVARGERHGNAKLTKEAVLEIRAAKNVSLGELAAKYLVSRSAIHNIIRKKLWTHV